MEGRAQTSVWTSSEIPENTQVEAVLENFTSRSLLMTERREVSCMVEVKYVNGSIICLGDQSNQDSWTNLVLPARNRLEQNLEVVREEEAGKTFYRALREILKGEELLAWFSPQLEEAIGIRTLTKENVRDEHHPHRFACSFCSATFFYPNALKVHALSLHNMTSVLANHPLIFPGGGGDSKPGLYGTPSKNPFASPSRATFNPHHHHHHHHPHHLQSPAFPQPGVATSNHHHYPRPANDMEYGRSATHYYQQACYEQLAAAAAANAAPAYGIPAAMQNVNASELYAPSYLSYKLPTSAYSSPTFARPSVDSYRYSSIDREIVMHTRGVQPLSPDSDPEKLLMGGGGGGKKRGHLCIYCGKLYSRKYGLKIHLRTHTGYKPLKCKVCLRPFGDPSNLNKHIRLHAEGETPYRCQYCGKVLVRRRDLERHIRSRHPDKHTERIEESKHANSEDADNVIDDAQIELPIHS